jgi:hypothetical protein
MVSRKTLLLVVLLLLPYRLCPFPYTGKAVSQSAVSFSPVERRFRQLHQAAAGLHAAQSFVFIQRYTASEVETIASMKYHCQEMQHEGNHHRQRETGYIYNIQSIKAFSEKVKKYGPERAQLNRNLVTSYFFGITNSVRGFIR